MKIIRPWGKSSEGASLRPSPTRWSIFTIFQVLKSGISTAAATIETACRQYVRDIGSEAAAKQYRDNPPIFLWIKNIWNPDVSYSHPIQDYQSFVNSINKKITVEKTVYVEDETTGEMTATIVKEQKSIGEIVDENMYENITAKLGEEKSQPNGYFILVVLSIGLMFLQQFITMRSQKDSTQLGSVDGSAQKQQKNFGSLANFQRKNETLMLRQLLQRFLLKPVSKSPSRSK